MTRLFSKLFYLLGDAVSRLLYFDCFAWLYPLYSKLMLLSLRLDKKHDVWQYSKDEQ
jgi:hypothetical protein